MEAGGYKRLVFILIDGAVYEVLRDLIDAGDLPALGALAEAGGGVKQAVTCFPSTTGPAYIPYFMGLFPGTANVPGYRWLSRAGYNDAGSRWTRPGLASYSGREAMSFDSDLPAGRPTWFDYFGSSRNVLNLLTKGSDPHDDLTRRIKPLVYPIGHYLHQWRLADIVAARALARAVKDGPQFIACSFNGVDGHSHERHSRAPKVIESYRTVDRAIAAARRLLKASGRDEETLWVIGSDHGHSETHTHIDVARALDRLGFPTLYYPRLWRRDAHCAEMVSGNGMTQVYFRGEDWRYRTPWEEIEARDVPRALLSLDGVDLVAGQTADGRTKLRTADGEATIAWSEGLCRYEYSGVDPVGCGAFAGLDSEAVLRLTFDSARPDACMQIPQLFRAERSGDIVVSARRGFDLRARWEIPEHHSTHGAIVPDQMHVPVIISHPVAADRFRTVDVFPTVLRLMGKDPAGEIDGVARL